MKKVWYYSALAVCIGVFCFSGVTLVKQLTEKNNSRAQMESLSAIMEEAAGGEKNRQDSEEPVDERAAYVEKRLANTEAVEKLQEKNSDVAGWVSIEDTQINYPVMHTPEDGEFYLKRDFDKKYSSYGMPFLDGECNLDDEYQNMLIYGHHMKDGSMFADLLKYEDEEFLESHPIIHFDTEEEFGDYQIIGVFKRSALNIEPEFLEIIRADTSERYDAFVDYVKNNGVVSTETEAEFGERLLTLMTCEYSQKEGRLFVVAKRVDSGVRGEEDEQSDN